MDEVSYISLALAVMLAIERIFKRVRHCRSACCSADLAPETSPKEIKIDVPKE